MKNRNLSLRTHVSSFVILTTAAILTSGCQSYEAAPLDLASHGDAVSHRLIDVEPLSDFAQRLAAMGASVPEHLDLADGLSPAEGEVLALFYNPELRIARAQAGVALATYETAGLWEDPEFGFDGAELLSPEGPFEFGLTLSLTIPLSGTPGIEKEVAASAYSTELLRIVDAEWTMRSRVRLAWAGWTSDLEYLRLLRDSIVQAERIVSITDRLESAGELTRSDARLVRAELVQLRSELIGATLSESRSRIELLGLLGLSPDAHVELKGAFPSADVSTDGDLVSRLIQHNTRLGVVREEYQTAEQSLRLEVQKQYPDISIGGGYGSEDRDDRLLLGLSIPIPIFNGNRAGIEEARARRVQARAVAETTFEHLNRELAMAQAGLEGARRQREALETQLVPMLDEQSVEVERLAELGEVDTLILLETITRHLEAKRRLLEARQAELSASLDIVRLLGPDVSMQPSPAETLPASPKTHPETRTVERTTGGVH